MDTLCPFLVHRWRWPYVVSTVFLLLSVQYLPYLPSNTDPLIVRQLSSPPLLNPLSLSFPCFQPLRQSIALPFARLVAGTCCLYSTCVCRRMALPSVSISSLTFMKKRMTLGELEQFSLVYFTHISHKCHTKLRARGYKFIAASQPEHASLKMLTERC
jgi:hypothetical protein